MRRPLIAGATLCGVLLAGTAPATELDESECPYFEEGQELVLPDEGIPDAEELLEDERTLEEYAQEYLGEPQLGMNLYTFGDYSFGIVQREDSFHFYLHPFTPERYIDRTQSLNLYYNINRDEVELVDSSHWHHFHGTTVYHFNDHVRALAEQLVSTAQVLHLSLHSCGRHTRAPFGDIHTASQAYEEAQLEFLAELEELGMLEWKTMDESSPPQNKLYRLPNQPRLVADASASNVQPDSLPQTHTM